MNTATLFPDRKLTTAGFGYLLFQLLVLPVLLGWFNSLLDLGLDVSRLNLLLYTVNFAALVGIFRKFLAESLRGAVKNISTVLVAAGVGFLAYRFSSTVVGIVTFHFVPDFQNVNDANIASMAQGDFTKWAFATVVLVPPAEELLFRGTLFGGLYNRSKILAWVLSVVSFALIHTVGYVGYYPWDLLLICTLQYLPAGICFAAAYRYCGNIFAPILIHAAVNALGILTMPLL